MVVAVVALCAVAGPLIAPDDPNAQDLNLVLAAPSTQHLLGTDDLGRDILSRVIDGARPALVGSLLVAIGSSLVLGTTLGLLAGYVGGRIDGLVMRWVDLMYSLPTFLIAIVVVGVLGGGYALAVALLALFFSPADVRIIRAAALEQRSLPYVEAARMLGLSRLRIIARHIFPTVLPVIIAVAFLDVAYALVTLSGLSFLGIGTPPGSADWGRMVAENRVYVFDTPAAPLSPAVMIVAAAASLNILGDWLSERLADRGRRR
jgi:peptide/nickel transport system permease protein